MKFLRFIGSNERRPAALVPEEDGFAARVQTLELPDGTFLHRCEFPGVASLNVAAQTPGLTVFGSLQLSTDKMPNAQREWLSAHGISSKAGDEVLNALRAVRDAAGVSFEKFDISLPY